jgi:zinc protease
VLVRVNIGDGLEAMPKDRQSLAWFGNSFIEGGLKQITNEETEQVLASKVYGARFGMARTPSCSPARPAPATCRRKCRC